MEKYQSEMITIKSSDDITAEASAWVAQLEAGDMTRADMEAFKEWIQRSPKHVAEIRKMARFSLALNELSEMLPSMSLAMDEHKVVMKKTKVSKRPWLALTAALVLMVSLVSFLVSPPPIAVETYYSKLGESKEVTLDDGSRVTLNTNSRISVAFDEANRVVKLIKGEAYFDVTANSERPFWVYTGSERVRVVGTEFLVQYIDEEFAVLVTEGEVSVAKVAVDADISIIEQRDKVLESEKNNHTLSLTPGEYLELGKLPYRVLNEDLVEVKSEKAIKQQVSWKGGLLDFTDKDLESVASEVSRYIPETIVVKSENLKAFKLSGVFPLDEPYVLFEALRNSYGLDVIKVDSNTFEIRSRNI
ncbi:MAG: FecR domain-containing protein [Paraglaciecola sp.]|uniref:FecR family protein n=1 Tax=Paraglaciecola sp. TaxID=1920173 RepID=UPI0032986004